MSLDYPWHERTPIIRRCLTVQSAVVHGYVGNKAATLTLQTHGIEADPLNTCQLSNHAGYPSCLGYKSTDEDLKKLTQGLVNNNLLSDVHSVLFGYLGAESFALQLPSLLDALEAKTSQVDYPMNPELPNLMFVCDPVLGESGHVYMPHSFIDLYKDFLIPRAFLVTPNQTEAEVLSGIKITSLDDVKRVVNAMHDIGAPNVIITSFELPVTETSDETTHFLHIPQHILEEEDKISQSGVLQKPSSEALVSFVSPSISDASDAVEKARPKSSILYSVCSTRTNGVTTIHITKLPKYAAYVSGTGDLFAALVTSRLCLGAPIQKAWETSLATIHHVLRRTIIMGRSELAIVQMSRHITENVLSVTSDILV